MMSVVPNQIYELLELMGILVKRAGVFDSLLVILILSFGHEFSRVVNDGTTEGYRRNTCKS